MKKVHLFLLGIVACAVANPAMGAVAIKKAASVAAAPKASTMDSAASLLPTVMGLVSGVQAIQQQTNELTADCVPTTKEITFVNDMVKEWARVGEMDAEAAKNAMGRDKCDGGRGFESRAQMALATKDMDLCFDAFVDSGDQGMVWQDFPKVGSYKGCPDGGVTCSEKNKKTISDIYEVFNIVGFSEGDYTAEELTMAGKLMEKMERCSSVKLNAKKKEMWGNFLANTMGSVGQKTNTGDIMQQVSSMNLSGGGGFQGAVGSLGSVMTSFMNK